MSMKANLLLVAVLCAVFMITGCVDQKTKAVQDLNSFINKVELEANAYDYEDWAKADIEFERLLTQLEQNYDSMSKQEKDVIMKTLGRFYGMQAKRNIQDAAKGVQNLLEALPAFIEGFSGAFDNSDN